MHNASYHSIVKTIRPTSALFAKLASLGECPIKKPHNSENLGKYKCVRTLYQIRPAFSPYLTENNTTKVGLNSTLYTRISITMCIHISIAFSFFLLACMIHARASWKRAAPEDTIEANASYIHRTHLRYIHCGIVPSHICVYTRCSIIIERKILSFFLTNFSLYQRSVRTSLFFTSQIKRRYICKLKI